MTNTKHTKNKKMSNKHVHPAATDATTTPSPSKRHRTSTTETAGMTRENHWQRLPIELVTSICEHLDVRSFRQMRCVIS